MLTRTAATYALLTTALNPARKFLRGRSKKELGQLIQAIPPMPHFRRRLKLPLDHHRPNLHLMEASGPATALKLTCGTGGTWTASVLSVDAPQHQPPPGVPLAILSPLAMEAGGGSSVRMSARTANLLLPKMVASLAQTEACLLEMQGSRRPHVHQTLLLSPHVHCRTSEPNGAGALAHAQCPWKNLTTVVEPKQHEQDAIFEVFWFTLQFSHHLLNLMRIPTVMNSWEKSSTQTPRCPSKKW